MYREVASCQHGALLPFEGGLIARKGILRCAFSSGLQKVCGKDM